MHSEETRTEPSCRPKHGLSWYLIIIAGVNLTCALVVLALQPDKAGVAWYFLALGSVFLCAAAVMRLKGR